MSKNEGNLTDAYSYRMGVQDQRARSRRTDETHPIMIIVISTPWGPNTIYDRFKHAHDHNIIEGECTRLPKMKELGHEEEPLQSTKELP